MKYVDETPGSRRRTVAGLGGCSGSRDEGPHPVELRGETFRTEESWPSFNGHGANTGYSPTDIPIESEPSVAWRAPVDGGLGYPVVGDGLAFSPDRTVLRAFAGGDVGPLERRLRWSADGGVSDAIVAAGDRLFVVAGDDPRELVALE